ncbi:outer membrane protein assembly factor BamA [Pseudogemmobacter sp. W21_MBD1_M6]|uniref:outer membrane protein assembly factor BamA n=1 Tax=Pseudogemmobacter sp. W21_MBD1_M6 TaxID=3240271 RepID=UPI003F97F84D
MRRFLIARVLPGSRVLAGTVFLAFATTSAFVPTQAHAQQYTITDVRIEGNQRVEPATILTYAGIARGQTLSAGQLNDAYQRIMNSGLFETVQMTPQGNSLLITVKEFPTINRIAIEGNARLKDEPLLALLRSQSRRVYSPTVAEADAAAIVEVYSQQGRIAATVEPRIIRRSDNRVDLVFQVKEGKVVEVQRISFVGNRAYSDSRLRRVLGTKQAGLLRAIIKSDTFVADRIEFDKQVLRDFYLSRGYVDFQTLSVASEVARERDGFFVTFNVREGQQFKFGNITASSDLADVDAQEFLAIADIKPGSIYNPGVVDNTIARMERLALQKSLNFIRVEPRVTRNERNLTLDIDFVLSRGPRVFVERIDIEGNNTTLDRVVRRQFKIVEGDPFNPREIRESAERIRALGFFASTDVKANEGSSANQVVVDVNVEEQPTGTLGFGASYGVDQGIGLTVNFSERNFLGRGQGLSFAASIGTDNGNGSFVFSEPALLGRDLLFRLSLGYSESQQDDAFYDTRSLSLSPSIEFPVSENGRLGLRYSIGQAEISNVTTSSSTIIQADSGKRTTSALGYTYTYETRRSGLNPAAGIVLRFGQDFAGAGGDAKYVRTSVQLGAETSVLNEDVNLRAQLEGGAVNMISGDSRITDRFFMNGSTMRGFSQNGIGPRDLTAANQDALGGNYFAVARFEAEFPVGLPEEYGLTGGVFFDVGSVWGLDNTAGSGGPVDDTAHLRSAIGVSVFWTTGIGPLRFNFSKALQKESYDKEQSFDLTISTQF